MTRTKNPAVNPAAKRRDLYVPAIILVGHSPDDAYLTWTRGGNNFVFKGDEGGAVQVAIVPPNTVRAAICRLPKGFQCVDRPRDPSYWTRCQNAVRFERQLGCLF
jgi:hypothetical protein